MDPESDSNTQVIEIAVIAAAIGAILGIATLTIFNLLDEALTALTSLT